MLELSGFKPLFAAAGNLYLLLMLSGVLLALWKGKTWPRKLIYAIVVVALFLAPIAPDIYRGYEYRNRLAKANALFDERCKTAGEKIYRTVDGVEGILLLKVRQYDPAQSDPMMAGAAAAHESYGDYYIRSFLLFERESTTSGARELIEDRTRSALNGYRYVDVVDQADGKRYRYTLNANTDVVREVTTPPAPRFGVTFNDIVDAGEREHWIAGNIVTVVDLKTEEVLGEFTGYVMDPGQGSRAGQRTPWLFAVGCNKKTGYGRDGSRLFVDQVLKPIRETSK